MQRRVLNGFGNTYGPAAGKDGGIPHGNRESVNADSNHGSPSLAERCKKYSLYCWAKQKAVSPLPVARAQGIFFWDTSGKRYLDFSSSHMNVNIGHQHPRVVRAICQQAETLSFAHRSMATEPRAALAQAIAEVTPGDLKKTFFCLGGGEANENAVKMARLYTGRQKVLARYRSYHGATYGAAALTGSYHRWFAEPAMPGVVHVFDPYCYRCPFGWTRATCHRECISHIEQVISFEGAENIAAIICEGVSGTSGVLVPPPEYWQRLREMTQRHGIVLISDEVITGFGRTGKWFAVDHWNIVPDIITVAKGMNSGYIPLAAAVVSEQIARFFDDTPLMCGLNSSAHPLACASAHAVLQVNRDERLVENARDQGVLLAQILGDMKSKHVCVGDVRSIGLLAAIELVSDRDSRQPLDCSSCQLRRTGQTASLSTLLMERGVHTLCVSNMLFVAPPLSIGAVELQEGLAIIDEVLSNVAT